VEPQHLKYWLIAIALLYLLFPRDLIPDFFGRGLGLIDDLLLMAALGIFYRKRVRDLADRNGDGSAQGESAGRERKARQKAPAVDPYQVLGIPVTASHDAIRSAYRSRMMEYHPDKVAHLGKELQELAHRKALEIQKAYEQLTK
jgi:DnaJ-domain-containing protein 1